MLSQGSFSRDVACDDGVCLVSLAWDGVVAVDASDSVNQFRAISHYAGAEFRDDRVPLGQQSLKRHSGAQKVYASTLRPRLFYVEHFNFSSRHFRLEDPLRSVRSRDLYFAELTGRRLGPASCAPPLMLPMMLHCPGPSGFRRTSASSRRVAPDTPKLS